MGDGGEEQEKGGSHVDGYGSLAWFAMERRTAEGENDLDVGGLIVVSVIIAISSSTLETREGLCRSSWPGGISLRRHISEAHTRKVELTICLSHLTLQRLSDSALRS
jgi:hypothetical protein